MTNTARVSNEDSPRVAVQELDAVIIGAGFAGMYALHRLRQLGLDLRLFDEADGVGGTWWWNRYPGARVDVPGGPFYCYTFSEELVREWEWSETQPDQASVLAYLNHVADKFDLRRDMELGTRVQGARFDAEKRRWTVETSKGERFSSKFLISATGTLSAQAANMPEIPGLHDFAGEMYHTGRWPQHEEVSFSGKRVGVIGTGSSGVQAIPLIAREAAHLTVFQRTPQYVVPGGNRPIPPEVMRHTQENWSELRQELIVSPQGAPYVLNDRSALDDTPEERQEIYEAAWERGGPNMVVGCYNDTVTSADSNFTMAEFVRSKIRQIVRDPEVAAKLMPDYYYGTKRQILGENYYEVYNQDNVTLVDLREDPITSITAVSVVTGSGEIPLDMLVLATGYDAMSGALRRLNPVGRAGLKLDDKWAEGTRTYLGLQVTGFPNLFMIHGPESPSVLYNMPMGAELQSDWIADCIAYMQENNLATIEPEPAVEREWADQVREIANSTLFPLTDSWYTGANIPGKPREFAIHLAGRQYYENLAEVARHNYKGFAFSKHAGILAPQASMHE